MDSMAKSLKEDYLTCVICFELFNEPKSLPCLHTFCEGCLEDLLCKSPNKIELTCPTCRETVPLQSQSVSSLKTNFIFKDIIVKLGCSTISRPTRLCSFCILHSKEVEATHKCITCLDLLCSFCVRHRHLFTRQTAYHTVISLNDYLAGKYKKEKNHEILCEKHHDKIRFFCPQCSVPICSECALMEHRYHEYVLFAEARHIIKEEIEISLKESKAKQEKLKQAKFSLISKSEEISSNETSLLAIVDSTFKEIQLRINKHRLNLEEQIKRKSCEENEKIKVYITENLNLQLQIEESVSFCENILSNRSDMEVVFFLEDMKSSLIKCSNQDDQNYQVILQSLEINVERELHKIFNLKEVVNDANASTSATVNSDTSLTAHEKQNTESTDPEYSENNSDNTPEREILNESQTNAAGSTAISPKCLKTYDLSGISCEKPRNYSSVTWISKTSFALVDEQNQTAVVVNDARGKTRVFSHQVQEIVTIAYFNDYLACKTQSGDIYIYSYPDWKLERTFKGAYALSSRSSELIWVTKEKIMIFAKYSIEEKDIKDEEGKSFKFRRPFQFCCLPNKSFALTDKYYEILYMLDQRGHISARLTLPGKLGALSCDQDNRIYLTCYESNFVSILDTNGKCLNTVSLCCILNRPKTISVRNEEAMLVANRDEVVLLSLT